MTNATVANVNLLSAWIGMVLGFISGAMLGLGFHQEGWLGGYGSFRRRLYRLGHISFFGLALVNLMFFFTVRALDLGGAATGWASRCFVAGAVTMPLCCLAMAHVPRARWWFAVPVTSLLVAGGLTVWEVARSVGIGQP